ncbi:MAG: putative pyridoxamine 5-phosphate oxidase [Verrucomicrobiaceae bacterium]|nr:putative pyridoxamine 5-phosphate oxidase [Verrucomicrobiaceae bacterium]
MDYETITSLESLRRLYAAPKPVVLRKERQQLDQFCRQFLELSPFAILATSDAGGRMDCSPRGDYPGFICALNDTEIALPDRPGNNRLDSIGNIVENPAVGLLALIPGFSDCLRINGRAKIAVNAELLARFEYQGKLPKSVIVISIGEIYFHCARAITRAQLWNSAAQIDRNIMPSLGRIIMAQTETEKSEEDLRRIDQLIEQGVKTGLY